MITAERETRLRLAARTLIEWRVPASTEQYRTVISDLLELHPDAASWGLNQRSKILELDSHGTILRYLSETLAIEQRTWKEDTDDETQDVSARVLNACYWNLQYYVDYGSRDEGSWPGGFYGEEFGKVLINALETSDRASLFYGYQALLGMLLLDDKWLQRKLISELMVHSDEPRDPSFKVMRIIYGLDASRWRDYLVSVNWVVGGVAYGLLGFVFSLAPPPIKWVALTVGLVCLAILLVNLLLLNVRFLASWWFGYPRIKDLGKRFVYSRRSAPAKFDMMTNEVCARNPALLIALIKTQSSDPIAEYVLRATKETSTDGARAMLAFFGSSEVKPSQLTNIFQWLCRVRIMDNLEPTL